MDWYYGHGRPWFLFQKVLPWLIPNLLQSILYACLWSSHCQSSFATKESTNKLLKKDGGGGVYATCQMPHPSNIGILLS
jgi:hypothetical protein